MNKKLKPPLLVILGPTGSGKSDLAIKLAKKFKGEIVNADSRQVYKEMHIGTGSPFAEITNYKSQIPNKFQITNSKQILKSKIKNQKSKILSGVPHHLFHFIRPNQEFSVAHYKELALKTIAEIHARGNLPILVGGTGLYIRVVVDNLDIPPVAPNKKLREKFEQELEKSNPSQPPLILRGGLSALSASSAKSAILKKYYQKLLKLDPEAAKTIDPHNPRRIIRALEVCLATKKPWSETQQKKEQLFSVLKMGIKLPRKELYKRIDTRVEKMFKQGLAEETKQLIKKYSLKLPALSGIGYKEVAEYISQMPTAADSADNPSAPSAARRASVQSALALIKFRTHAYARRQETWFRKTKGVQWVNTAKQAEKVLATFQNIKNNH